MAFVSLPSLLGIIIGLVIIATLLWLYQNLPLVLLHDGRLAAFLVTVCAMTGVILFAFVGFIIRETSDRSERTPPVVLSPSCPKNPSKIS